MHQNKVGNHHLQVAMFRCIMHPDPCCPQGKTLLHIQPSGLPLSKLRWMPQPCMGLGSFGDRWDRKAHGAFAKDSSCCALREATCRGKVALSQYVASYRLEGRRYIGSWGFQALGSHQSDHASTPTQHARRPSSKPPDIRAESRVAIHADTRD